MTMTRPKTIVRSPSRRRALAHLGVLGASPLLVRAAALAAESGTKAKRILIVHRSTGTVPGDWFPKQAGETFETTRLMQPLAPLRSKLLALGGIDVTGPQVFGLHGVGLVYNLTGVRHVAKGAFKGPGIAGGPSIDQVLLKSSRALQNTPIPSLQLAADNRSDRMDVWTRVLSYAGPQEPLFPEHEPHKSYARVLSGYLPGGSSPENMERADRVRRMRKSVLDFIHGDLGRLRASAPRAELAKLDAHTEATRDLERSYDQIVSAGAGVACNGLRAPEPLPPNSGAHHEAVGKLQFDLIKHCFRCSLSHVATFMWAGGSSHVVTQEVVPSLDGRSHHALSHSGSEAERGAMDLFYTQKMADFVAELDKTPDGPGETLLDNTLVYYFSEVGQGNHNFKDIPIVLFGGRNMGLATGRYLHFDRRSTNDVWTALTPVFGVEMKQFGDAELNGAPLPGLRRT